VDEVGSTRAIRASVVIDRPIETVFGVVVDMEAAPRWQAELVRVKDLLPTPMDVGTTMTVVLLYLGRGWRTECRSPHRASSFLAQIQSRITNWRRSRRAASKVRRLSGCQ
jgi:hypothetical protein